MKYLLVLLLLFCNYAFADTKISQLTRASSNASTDLGVLVTNPGSNPVTQNILLGNMTVGKATALVNTPNQCNGGNYPLGVDTGGNAVNCTPVPTECATSGCSLNSATTLAGSAIVTTSGLQTLTNKTESSPTLSGTITLSSLTINTPLYVNGSGVVSSGTWGGNTTKVANISGTLTSGNCIKSDANGNIVDNGATCGGGGGGSGTVNSGTAGQSAYYATSTNTVSGTPNLVYVGSNVGIGSASPGQNLDVTGTVRTTNFVSNTLLVGASYTGNTPPTNGALIQGNVGVGSLSPGVNLDVTGTVRATQFIGGGAGITGISGSISGLTTSNIPKAGSSTTIVNGDLTDLAPNIGVGSTAPGQTLDVNGTLRVGFNSIFTGNVGIATSSALNNQLTVQGAIQTQGNTNNTLLNIGGGNVGIGSATPGVNLDVNGTIRMTGFQLNSAPLAGGNVLVSTSVGIGTWMSPASIGASGGGTIAGITSLNGNIGIGSTAPGANLDVNGTIRLVGTGTSYFGSNVGIGSLIPGAALDIQGTVRAIGYTGQSGHGLLGVWATGTSFGSISPQLTTDGFIMATCTNTGSALTTVSIYTDSSSSPSTLRCQSIIGSATGGTNFCISPVRKGDYYEVTQANGCTASPTVNFIPLGN